MSQIISDRMESSLKGRISNLSFRPKKEILFPLFEAIANSLQSIVIADKSNGIINIVVDRETRLELDDNQERPIQSIKITDNGIGFNNENYKAFCLLDDSKKREKFGCKGIGRLLWLKAFESVQIESIYQENSLWEKRAFSFNLQWPDNNKMEVQNIVEPTKRSTTVYLKNLSNRYKKVSAKTIKSIKDEIIRQFLPTLILLKDRSIEITLSDNESQETINCGTLPKTIEEEIFKVRDIDFKIQHIQTEYNDGKGHCIHYCAGDRVAKTEAVIQFTKNKLQDSSGEDFYYAGYVTSKYLDDNVNSERTDFTIEDEYDDNFLGDISWDIIKSEVNQKVSSHLDVYKQNLEKQRQINIDEVFKEMPHLIYVKDMNQSDLNNKINFDDSKNKIKKTIAIQHFENQFESSENIHKVIKNIDGKSIKTFDDFKNQYQQEIDKFSRINNAELGQYIIYRKTILDIFSKALGKLEGNAYEYERTVHNLIFPMSTDSVDAREAHSKHNLWIIDDRFAFFDYVASDLDFSKHQVIEQSEDSEEGRPDIALYYNLGFVPDIKEEIRSVVIIEFKRPGRTQYDKNPIQQVLDYIGEYKSKKIKIDGREPLFASEMQYYAYIICDIQNPRMQKYIDDCDFLKRTPDGHGYFGYHTNHNAYIEIIPFAKLLKDAKDRNNVFFKKVLS